MTCSKCGCWAGDDIGRCLLVPDRYDSGQRPQCGLFDIPSEVTHVFLMVSECDVGI